MYKISLAQTGALFHEMCAGNIFDHSTVLNGIKNCQNGQLNKYIEAYNKEFYANIPLGEARKTTN